MERAQTRVVLPPFFQPDVRSDYINDVGGGADFFDFLVWNAHGVNLPKSCTRGNNKHFGFWNLDFGFGLERRSPRGRVIGPTAFGFVVERLISKRARLIGWLLSDWWIVGFGFVVRWNKAAEALPRPTQPGTTHYIAKCGARTWWLKHIYLEDEQRVHFLSLRGPMLSVGTKQYASWLSAGLTGSDVVYQNASTSLRSVSQ